MGWPAGASPFFFGKTSITHAIPHTVLKYWRQMNFKSSGRWYFNGMIKGAWAT
jgi:hypothetical protein